ncbi:MAG: penicillin acylase family protein [Marinobacter sp.]|uniref:penicillin acylase family protein n=1 Tax=Marinobacter sp. TaxID=50741 RepID=UPI0032971C85
MTYQGKRNCSWLLAGAVALALTGCNNSNSSSSPSVDDTQASSVTIKRDNYGVPHVYADSTYGLYYGYGYALAQDRLFQMEMIKRSVLGTVSEVLGPDYLSLDRSSRTGFDPDSIKSQLQALPKEDLDIFKGYAEGFNKRIQEVEANPSELLPKQFSDFKFAPEEWTAFDVAMLYVGTMAGRYSNSSSSLSDLTTQCRSEIINTTGAITGLQ